MGKRIKRKKKGGVRIFLYNTKNNMFLYHNNISINRTYYIATNNHLSILNKNLVHNNSDNYKIYSNYNYKKGKIIIVLHNNSFQKELCLARVPAQSGNWGDILSISLLIYYVIFFNTSKLF